MSMGQLSWDQFTHSRAAFPDLPVSSILSQEGYSHLEEEESTGTATLRVDADILEDPGWGYSPGLQRDTLEDQGPGLSEQLGSPPLYPKESSKKYEIQPQRSNKPPSQALRQQHDSYIGGGARLPISQSIPKHQPQPSTQPRRSTVSESSSGVSNGVIVHDVKPHETLEGIALLYNVKIAEIKRANRLYSNSLSWHKTLNIPVIHNSTSISGESNIKGSADAESIGSANKSNGDISTSDFLKDVDTDLARARAELNAIGAPPRRSSNSRRIVRTSAPVESSQLPVSILSGSQRPPPAYEEVEDEGFFVL